MSRKIVKTKEPDLRGDTSLPKATDEQLAELLRFSAKDFNEIYKVVVARGLKVECYFHHVDGKGVIQELRVSKTL